MADAATWKKHVAAWRASGEDSFADSSQISPLLELIEWPFFWRDRLVRLKEVRAFRLRRMDEPGSKISLISRMLGWRREQLDSVPRLRSSRIILRARTFFASTLTAGPRSS